MAHYTFHLRASPADLEFGGHRKSNAHNEPYTPPLGFVRSCTSCVVDLQRVAQCSFFALHQDTYLDKFRDAATHAPVVQGMELGEWIASTIGVDLGDMETGSICD